MKLVTCLRVLALAIAVHAIAPAPNALATSGEPPAQGDDLLELRLPGFFGGPTLKRMGVKVDFGYHGEGYETAFAGSPEALQHARVYRVKRIAGTALNVIGMASMVAEIVVVLVAPEAISGSNTVAGLSWLAGSMVVSTVGSIVSQSANTDLNRAVESYNFTVRSAPSTPSVGIRLSGHF